MFLWKESDSSASLALCHHRVHFCLPSLRSPSQGWSSHRELWDLWICATSQGLPGLQHNDGKARPLSHPGCHKTDSGWRNIYSASLFIFHLHRLPCCVPHHYSFQRSHVLCSPSSWPGAAWGGAFAAAASLPKIPKKPAVHHSMCLAGRAL